MTKFEAIEAMKAGHKVRHRYFSPDEWVTIKDHDYLFEDGVICSPTLFWMDRQGEMWNNDWEIYNEK
jgi:hypothetical protein